MLLLKLIESSREVRGCAVEGQAGRVPVGLGRGLTWCTRAKRIWRESTSKFEEKDFQLLLELLESSREVRGG